MGNVNKLSSREGNRCHFWGGMAVLPMMWKWAVVTGRILADFVAGTAADGEGGESFFGGRLFAQAR